MATSNETDRIKVKDPSNFRCLYYVYYVGGPLAEWLRHWTLNHEIVGSSPVIHLVFGA